MDRSEFALAFGEYLAKQYSELYRRGVEIAVRETHCQPHSVLAFWYGVGYIQGYLSTTEISYLVNPTVIH